MIPAVAPGSVHARIAATIRSTKSAGMNTLFARSIPFTTPALTMTAPITIARAWKISGRMLRCGPKKSSSVAFVKTPQYSSEPWPRVSGAKSDVAK